MTTPEQRSELQLRIRHGLSIEFPLQWIDTLITELDSIISVIKDIHSQHADDLCWMDIDRIFQAVNLLMPDRRVGDKAAMKRNCNRFIDVMCQGGEWKSYAELERENAHLKNRIKHLERELEFEGLR